MTYTAAGIHGGKSSRFVSLYLDVTRVYITRIEGPKNPQLFTALSKRLDFIGFGAILRDCCTRKRLDNNNNGTHTHAHQRPGSRRRFRAGVRFYTVKPYHTISPIFSLCPFPVPSSIFFPPRLFGPHPKDPIPLTHVPQPAIRKPPPEGTQVPEPMPTCSHSLSPKPPISITYSLPILTS